MTKYLERALAGERATADEWNDHLIAFHRAFPNVTARLIGEFRTAASESSYQHLARHVHERSPSAKRIVDVGCGSGELLLYLDAAYNGTAELAGIDLVASELELARRLVPRAMLICGDAAELLPLQHIDVAVGHMSFLSMARLRDALRRIYDFLLPGGLLAFIVEDLNASESVITMMAPPMRASHDRHPGMNLAVPERDGAENDATLCELLKATGFTDAIEIESIVLSASLSSDEIIEFALKSYPFGLLDDDAQSELRAHLRASLLNDRNETLVKLPLKLVTACRGDAISNTRPSTAMEYRQ